MTPHSSYGSPQSITAGSDMMRRCSSVEPDRQPAQRRKIGDSPSWPDRSPQSFESSARPVAILAPETSAFVCWSRARRAPTNAEIRYSSQFTLCRALSVLEAVDALPDLAQGLL